MRASEEMKDSADAGSATAESACALSRVSDPFDILARLPRPNGPTGGGDDSDGDDFDRPRPSVWLGVDTPFRIGHD